MSRRRGRAQDTDVNLELASAVAQKDQQIHDLRTQLSLRATVTSNLQNRLLYAIDKMDTSRASFVAEIKRANSVIQELSTKLSLAEKARQETETEEADMRDAVMMLVERVEISNGYGNLNSACIQFAGPLLDTPLPSLNNHAGPSSESGNYTDSIVRELTRQLAQEQRVHMLTVKEADARITALKAQVARREAELEHLVYYGRKSAAADVSGSRRRSRENDVTLFSQEEAAEIISSANERNAALEAEVHSLSMMHRKTVAASQPRASSSHETSNITRHGDDNPQAPRQTIIPQMTESARGQVKQLGDEIDKLRQERDMFQRDIRTKPDCLPEPPASIPDKDFRSISLVEEECIRLQRVEAALLRDLEDLRNSSQARELALQEEIVRLQDALHRSQSDRLPLCDPQPELTLDSTEETDTTMESFPPLVPVPEQYLMSLQSPPSTVSTQQFSGT